MICVGNYGIKFNFTLVDGQQNVVSEFKLSVFYVRFKNQYTQTVEAGFVVESVTEMIFFLGITYEYTGGDNHPAYLHTSWMADT